jgi:RNA polymerase sigma-70 factor (ECF subfamily)
MERRGVSLDRHPTRDFDPLFDAHYAEIYRYCLRRLGPADADDATAEVFAVAWRRLGDIHSVTSPRAWLFGIAYKVVGNQYRGARRREGLLRRLARNEPDPGQDSPDPLVLKALSQLSSADQELLRLSVWDGLDRSEVARVLGIKENAVDQRLHRARARLKDRYERMTVSPVESQEAST